jgi:hypothetical protein
MYSIVTAIVLLAVGTAVRFTGFTASTLWAVEAALLLWTGIHWKKRWIWLAALGLFAVSALQALLTPGLLMQMPINNFTLIANLRALALFVLTLSLAEGTYLFGKLEHPDAFLAKRVLNYGWIVTLFLLMTLETSDHFFKLMTISSGEQKVSLAFYRRMYMAAIWMLYSLPLVWFGLKKQVPPLFLSGIGMLSIAVGLGGVWSMAYAPIEHFTPLANVRAALLAFLIVGIVLHSQWLIGVRRRYHRLEALMHFTWGLLLFEFCTVETNDYFRHLMQFSNDAGRAGIVFSRFMTLSAVWMVLSLPLVRIGLARKMKPTLYLGLWALLLSLGMSAIRGIAFDPIEDYTFVINYRALIIVLIIAGSLVHATWIRYSGQLFGMLFEALRALRIAVVILILVLLTAEARDFFEKQIFLATAVPAGTAFTDAVSSLEHTKQLVLSSVWLICSIGLMVFGLWRHDRTFRIIAMVLFAIAMLKLPFYDLSFLDTGYRVASFAGLAAILIAGWYLLKRYRSVILASTPLDQGKGRDHIVL